MSFGWNVHDVISSITKKKRRRTKQLYDQLFYFISHKYCRKKNFKKETIVFTVIRVKPYAQFCSRNYRLHAGFALPRGYYVYCGGTVIEKPW